MTDSQPLSCTAHRATTIAGHTVSPGEADTLLGTTAGHDTLDAALNRILDRTRAGAAQRSAVSRTNR